MVLQIDLCWFGCRGDNVTAGSRGRCWYPSPAYSHADDWSKGEAGYEALCASGFVNEVRVVSLD